MTKPIELGVKKTELPKPQAGKNRPPKGRKEAFVGTDQRSEAEIMALVPVRARKIGPQPEIFDQIGQRLRNVYNDVLTQSVPDRFLDLLQTLEAGTQGETQGKTEVTGSQDGRTVTRRQKDLK